MEILNLNQSEEARAMSDSVKTLFESAHKVLSVHCKLNALAMCAMQSLGYNGFKRWHRYRSKQFFDLKLKLANELFDHFKVKADFKETEVTYSPASVEEHLKSWEKALLDGIQELGTLAKSYFDLTGMECEIISCAMKKLAHDHEKVSRYLKRFTESDWLALDMHIVDDHLHEKYKCKENGEQNLWNTMMNSFGKKY